MVVFLKNKLRCYGLSFLKGNDDDVNIRLKIAHSYRVWREMTALCASESVLQADTDCLEIVALLHDWSRFEQVCKFHTFNDAISFDHGNRSAALIREQQLLTTIPSDVANDLLAAISGHNKLIIPAGFTPRACRWCQALRDADKLDIMKLILHHLRHPENSSITFNLRMDAPITPAVAESLRLGCVPKHSEMKSAVDFLAGKLLWIKDLNFNYSRAEFKRRNYIGQLFDYLSKVTNIEDIFKLPPE